MTSVQLTDGVVEIVLPADRAMSVRLDTVFLLTQWVWP
jgi:hypothetical protein